MAVHSIPNWMLLAKLRILNCDSPIQLADSGMPDRSQATIGTVPIGAVMVIQVPVVERVTECRRMARATLGRHGIRQHAFLVVALTGRQRREL